MPPQLISTDSLNFLFMHVMGSRQARGLLFLVRRDGQFAVLPFFPGQGVLAPEAELRSCADLADAIFSLMGDGWEVIARAEVDHLAVRSGAPFWPATIARLRELSAATRQDTSAATARSKRRRSRAVRSIRPA